MLSLTAFILPPFFILFFLCQPPDMEVVKICVPMQVVSEASPL